MLDKVALTIGQLAREAGVNVETVRFYQRRGLLPEPDRPTGGIRRYASIDTERIRFIKAAQRLGFSLDDVEELLRLEDGTHCSQARQLAERKLAEIRSKIDDLRRIESALDGMVGRCRAARGKVSCPLIASVHRAGATQHP
jgi:MerR family transcriptional regulator, mercuric resistance operon regulatory protein